MNPRWQNYRDHWKGRFADPKRLARDALRACWYMLKAYLLFIAILFPFQRGLMYFPIAEPVVDPARYGIEVVSYKTADGLTLKSWYIPPQPGMPVFVAFHGNGVNVSHRAGVQLFFARKGYGFLSAEYRGYSGNPGRPHEQGLYADARAAMQWLRGQGIETGRMVVFGQSIGTGVAVQMAVENRDLGALVLEAPFTTMADVVSARLPWLTPAAGLMLDRYENSLKMPDIAAPLFIAHGDADTLIPASQAMALYQLGRMPEKRMSLIKGGSHIDLTARGMLEEIDLFLREKAGVSLPRPGLP